MVEVFRSAVEVHGVRHDELQGWWNSFARFATALTVSQIGPRRKIACSRAHVWKPASQVVGNTATTAVLSLVVA
jgi:hypothetical protein